MEIRAVFFDVGGCLHSNAMDFVKVDIQETLKITPEQFKRAWPLMLELEYGSISEEEFWKRFIEQSGSNEPIPDSSLLYRGYIGHSGINNEVLSIVQMLGNQVEALGVMSNTIAPHVRYLNSLEIFKPFKEENRIYSYEIGSRKPEREIYLVGADRLGVKPEEAILIDDNSGNIYGDKHDPGSLSVGMRGIVYQSPQQLVNDLKEFGLDLAEFVA